MKKSELPKYIVVENKIRKAIRRRFFVDKLPGERVLAKTFEVSYMTLRKAIENLVAKGVLYKIPTQGTYVSNPETSIDEMPVSELRQEILELRKANQILQKAATYYASAQHIQQ